jgi:serine/threonine-protein phosphatase 2A regulatory subunit A
VVADQDSVRLLAVEGCATLGKLLEPADCIAQVLPVIVSFSQVGVFHMVASGLATKCQKVFMLVNK